MNNINRPLVKSQARQIIKGKVFLLFVIYFIVAVLTGGITTTVNFATTFNDAEELFEYNYGNGNSYYDDYNYDDYNYFDDDYFSDFYDGSGNPIDGFDFSNADMNVNIKNTNAAVSSPVTLSFALLSLGGGLSTILAIVFAPLAVTLAGMYVSLVRRNANEHFDLGKELGGIFKNSFNDTYFKKLLLSILVGIITTLLAILFIIPGIIFSYSAYFSSQIMNDYPNLKPTEAIKLSKKMIKGNRWELFVYDLSFIPWYLLTMITFGIAGIYVYPYKCTADALYYENFRLRALAEGRITEDDFLSEQERIMKYNNAGYNTGYQQGAPYYNPGNTDTQGTANTAYQPYQQYQPSGQNHVNNADGTFYSPDFSAQQQYDPYANPSQPNQTQGTGYYQPPQYQQPAQPQQPAEPRYDQSAPAETQAPVQTPTEEHTETPDEPPRETQPPPVNTQTEQPAQEEIGNAQTDDSQHQNEQDEQ